MNIPITRRVSTGQPYRPSAGVQNELIEVANRFNDGSLGAASGGRLRSDEPPACVIRVSNATGADRVAGEIVSLTGALAEWPKFPREAAKIPALEGNEPAAVTDAVGVLIDDLPDADAVFLARAVVLGVTTCRVNMTDAGHKFATATVGDCSKLTSAATGPIRILDVASGTGTKEAMVLLADSRSSGGTARSYVRIIDVDDYGSGYGLDQTRTFTARPVTFLADGGVLDVDSGGGLDFLIGEEDEHNLIVGDDHAYLVEADSNGFQRINIGPLASYDASQPRYTPGIMGAGQKQYFRGVKIFGDYGGANTDNQQGNVWSEAICWLGSDFATEDDITSCNGWASVAQAADGDGFLENTLTFFISGLNPDITIKNGDESTGGAGGLPGMGGVQFVQYPDSGNEFVAIRFGVSEIRSSASFGDMKFQSSGYSFSPSGGIHTGYVDFAVANLFVWSDASTQHTGWSGTFTAGTKTVTVVHGLITNVA